MHAYTRGLVLAAAVAADAACGGGDGGSGPNPADVTGTWQLTKVLFVSQADSQQSVDLVAQGATATLTINRGFTFTYIVTMPADAPDTTTGSWSLSSNVLTMVRDGVSGILQFDVTVSGQILRLADAEVEFDINNDGTDEPAFMTIEGTK